MNSETRYLEDIGFLYPQNTVETQYIASLQPAKFKAMEFELPILRDLDGPQLETDWQFTLGLQSSF